MTQAGTGLFREEVLKAKQVRLHGPMIIVYPLKWQLLSVLALVFAACLIGFAAVASYARTEAAAGLIIPDRGLTHVVASRPGIVTSVPVAEGDFVKAGTLLVALQAEESQAEGRSASAQVAEAIASQDANLVAQSRMVANSLRARVSQITAQISGISGEIGQLVAQLEVQDELVRLAESDFNRAQEIAERGFLSRKDLAGRQDTLLSRKQQLFALRQSLLSKRSQLTEAIAEKQQAATDGQSQIALIDINRAEVAQQAATNQGNRAYAIRAPVSGVITAVSVTPGQRSADAPLMTIMPTDAKLIAQVNIPTHAAGFIKPGQRVTLAVDAFPYERFGTIDGEILSVSRVAVSIDRTAAQDVETTAFISKVRLARTSVRAFGEERSLVPGMKVTARIVTDRETFLEWLLEPLYAVSRR